MKTALITGSTGGIGSAVARKFAQAGYQLVLLDKVQSDFEGALSLKCDVSNPEDVAHSFEQIQAKYESIDVLANIAGINLKSSIHDMDAALWNQLYKVNVGGMFLCAKHAIPLLSKSANPSIVNMASISGHVASADYPAYVTSKAVVESFTAGLSQEAGRLGIRVNAVAPGWVDGGFTDEARKTHPAPDELDKMARSASLLGRMAKPDEIADAVFWLASEKASFVTGQTMLVDGGLMRVH